MTDSLAALSDADLRDFCAKASPDNGRTNWNAWNRPMLLAFCWNRWPEKFAHNSFPQLSEEASR